MIIYLRDSITEKKGVPDSGREHTIRVAAVECFPTYLEFYNTDTDRHETISWTDAGDALYGKESYDFMFVYNE